MVAYVPGRGWGLVLTDDDVADLAEHEPEVLAVMDEILDAAFAAWLARLFWLLGSVFEVVLIPGRDDTPVPALSPLELLTDRWPIGPPVASAHRDPAGVNRAA